MSVRTLVWLQASERYGYPKDVEGEELDFVVVATVVGTLVALVGLPATYYWGRRNRQRPDLCYVRDFAVLMAPEDGLAGGHLKMTANGQNIKSISRTYVALFNMKGDSVDGSHVVALDPLRLTVEDGDSILQTRIMSQSRPQCAVALNFEEGNDREVYVNFDFLDAKDGVIVEVLHQGSSPVAVKGTIKGATLRDKGRADLTPHVIRALAAKTLWARIKFRFSGKFRIINIATALMTLLLVAMVVTVWVLPRPEATAPIPLTGLDLTTLEGQRQFVADAIKAGVMPKRAIEAFLPFSVIVTVPLLFVAYLWWRLLKPLVPTSITSDIKQADESNEEA